MTEEARWLAQPETPKSERRRSSWGSLLMSAQTVPGLCPKPKCVRKADHAGGCWPSQENLT